MINIKMSDKSSGMASSGTSDKLIELEVYGLVMGPYQGRPLLLMKDKEGSNILPVGLNDLEAQILAFGSDRQDGPHGASLEFFRSSGLKVNRVLFTEVRGQRQVLNIHIVKSDQPDTENVVEAFAESTMSYCLGHKAPIYASQKFIDECRRTPLDFHLANNANFTSDKVPPHLVQ